MPALPALLAAGALAAGCAPDEPRAPRAGAAPPAAERVTLDDVAPASAFRATLPAYRAGAVANGGSVSGSVLLDGVGRPPAAPPLGTRPACAPPAPGGAADAVVWLEGVRTGKPQSPVRRYELRIDHCGVHPRALAAAAGGTLNVHAVDDVRGRLRFARADSPARGVVVLRAPFSERGQVVPDERVLASAGAVEVRGETQPWLRAWVLVFDHPYFASPGDAGRFAITDVPPGTYQLVVWAAGAGRVSQPVTVTAGTEVTATVRLGPPRG